MIRNFTNHVLRVYDIKDVHANRERDDVFYLNSTDVKPKIEVQKNFKPLNVHYHYGFDLSVQTTEGISIKGIIDRCSTDDLIPNNIDLQNDILVVSSRYANDVLRKLPLEILDALFIPCDKVLDINGNIIGATGLRKIIDYQLPSLYLNNSLNIHSKKLAIEYWKQNQNFLNVYELNCLHQLINLEQNY